MSSDYYCPISYEIMSDPVICSDGTTYQRENIVRWLQTNNTSPLTGLPLSNLNLIPNLILKSIIREQFPDIDISSTSTSNTSNTNTNTNSNSSQTNNENVSYNFQNTDTLENELQYLLQDFMLTNDNFREIFNNDNNLIDNNNIINNIIIDNVYL